MDADSPQRPTLPGARAFVVLLSADCDPARDDLRGRVEHVRSGHSVHFESLDELLRFVARITAADDEPA
jgi:hypothetical protein